MVYSGHRPNRSEYLVPIVMLSSSEPIDSQFVKLFQALPLLLNCRSALFATSAAANLNFFKIIKPI